MTQEQNNTLATEKSSRLIAVFEKLLPMVDAVSDKIRLFVILGFFATIWLVVWCFVIKHYHWGIGAAAGLTAFLPTLILSRFWWALEELKNLPDIAGEMVGDAKSELKASVQDIRTGSMPKISLFSAGKSLWSIGAMASEAKELLGSYLSVATLANPLMMVLGLLSLFGIMALVFLGVILAFFV
jgi:hypothetical protein